MSPSRIPVVERILGANHLLAVQNRQTLDARGVHAVNFMASPGAGKTSLIIRTAQALRGRRSVGVIEGDIASTVDAEKVREAGFPVVQINTGGACHLDATLVGRALGEIALDGVDLLLIENVGNLICPVAFDLGEHTKVAISSVPEGDDKPHKYPGIFSSVDALVINNADLLPAIPFDGSEFRRLVRGLNPDISIFEVSCLTGAGLDEWVEWLTERTARD